jgi:hypothetical protein
MTDNRSPDRFTWTPEQVQVTPPPCQACGKPAGDDQVAGLCRQCALRIDADYEWLRDLAELEAGP